MNLVRHSRLACSLLCLLATAASCAGRNPGGEEGSSSRMTEAVVRVGDRYFSRAELDRFFQARLREFENQEGINDVKGALLEDFVDERLLLGEAKRLGVAVDPQSVKAVLEVEEAAPGGAERADEVDGSLEQRIADSLRVQQYLRKHVFPAVRVTEEECRQYYEDHEEDFVRSDVVHIREILVDDPALADRIQAQLKARRNRNFAELARLHSKAPSAAQGGNLGTFERGELPEKLERVIFRLAPGTVSKTLTTEFGYHIFFMEEKVLAHQLKFFEARKEIEQKLLLERQREALSLHLAGLEQSVPVEIYRMNLDFPYAGKRFSSPGVTRP